MHWFTRLFKSNSPAISEPSLSVQMNLSLSSFQKDITHSLQEVKDQISESQKEQARNLRRLALAQKQQGEELKEFSQHQMELKSMILADQGALLSLESGMELLDQMHKIASISQDNAETIRLVEEMQQYFCQLFMITPIAVIGVPYPSKGCEISAAIGRTDLTPGTVVEILEQGFQYSGGDILRAAHVIVSKLP